MYLFCLFSCRNSPEPVFKHRETTSDLVKVKILDHAIQATHPDSIVEIVRYVKLETKSESLISNYSKVLSCGDTIFIMDKSQSQQCILAFNFDGDFLFKLDARGRGPGEYLEIKDFFVDSKLKQIGILNWGNVNIYDFNGNFIATVNLRKYNIQNIEYRDNRLYAYKCPDCRTKKCLSFAAFDLNGNLLYEDYPEREDLLFFPFQKPNYFASNSSHTYLNLLNSDTIYEVGKNYLQPRFLLDFGKFKLPGSEFEKLIHKGIDYVFDYFSKSDYPLFGLSKFSATDDYLCLSCIGYKVSSTTIYSFKTSKTKNIYRWYPTQEILFPGDINSLNSELFYGIMSTTEILKLVKIQDEYDGILDSAKKFSQRRIEKYNFIKDIKPEDNNILILFKIKDF